MKNRLVCGIGINNANYAVCKYEYQDGKRKQVWVCPIYRTWKHMLQRCYSAKTQEKQPTYKGCSVCEEWLTFSNFKTWMEGQDWMGKELDKDLLFPGNKIYSPDTCVFLDRRINGFLAESNANRGQYMIGVCWHIRYNKFVAQCKDGSGKQKHLGFFNTQLEAHKAWLVYKLERAYELATEQDDPRVAKALIDRYQEYNYLTACVMESSYQRKQGIYSYCEEMKDESLEEAIAKH